MLCGNGFEALGTVVVTGVASVVACAATGGVSAEVLGCSDGGGVTAGVWMGTGGGGCDVTTDRRWKRRSRGLRRWLRARCGRILGNPYLWRNFPERTPRTDRCRRRSGGRIGEGRRDTSGDRCQRDGSSRSQPNNQSPTSTSPTHRGLIPLIAEVASLRNRRPPCQLPPPPQLRCCAAR
jgi:hypothetical protein